MNTERLPDYPIETVFLDRWSPRAYDTSAMPDADLFSILEAARWAPSAFNVQPWRFLYSHRNDEHWQKFLSLLDAFNTDWAQHASVLIIALSDTVMPGDDNRAEKLSSYHSFDTGAAWAQLALQATALGYHAHAMAGIHFEESRCKLVIPERYRIEVAIAIGKRANPAQLSQMLRDRELPSKRFPVSEIAFAGSFPQ